MPDKIPAGEIVDRSPPATLASRAAFFRYVHRGLRKVGSEPYIARSDEGGNCLICGEAGRCPGYPTAWEVEPPVGALWQEEPHVSSGEI